MLRPEHTRLPLRARPQRRLGLVQLACHAREASQGRAVQHSRVRASLRLLLSDPQLGAVEIDLGV
jgi:hypothetical protein